MKSINIYFEDLEFDSLLNLKKKLNLSWRNLILKLIKDYEKNNQNETIQDNLKT